MKIRISGLNKLFENRVRLAIMSVLMINNSFDFINLKDNNMIKVTKQFKGRKPNTAYSITETGINTFRVHLKTLEEIINAH
jgi:hypothetical protein